VKDALITIATNVALSRGLTPVTGDNLQPGQFRIMVVDHHLGLTVRVGDTFARTVVDLSAVIGDHLDNLVERTERVIRERAE
jgi:hypothetical protein